MKKRTLFLLFFWVSTFATAFAAPIDSLDAVRVAVSFYKSVSMSSGAFTIVQTRTSVATNTGQTKVLYYVLNTQNRDNQDNSNTEGYVIVAGDDAALPILAYSTQSNFNPKNVPSNMAKWLEGYANEMRDIIENKRADDATIRQKWQKLRGDNQNTTVALRLGVTPLVATRWDQSPYYNALCPYDYGASKRTPSGCVATAMAQIMKFWNAPSQGTGSHSYFHDTYGQQSANFGTTTYNWSAMPNSLSGSNSAIATLMYHCGVAVDMDYGPQGSGAYVISSGAPTVQTSEYALKNYFSYDPATLRGVARSSYTSANWVNLLKTELNAGRPILHTGHSSEGGHAFVCDGYDNNDYFHFNWGWGGQSDGYFLNYALNPGSLGTGGGSGGYNSKQQVLIGIKPLSGGGGGGGSNPTSSIEMYSNITVTPSVIPYNTDFSVNADIINRGTGAFKGDISAVMFDSDGDFVDYVEILTESDGLPINYHYTNGLTFDNTGIAEATPGTYTIKIYVKPTGATNWTAVKGTSAYANTIQVTVASDNSVQLYGSPIAVTPQILQKDGNITVKCDVVNRGAAAFTGQISADIHDYDTGDWIQTIYTFNNINLSVNNHFSNGLTFSGTLTGLATGTYTLAIWAKPTGGDWDLVGSSSNLSNPVTITIAKPQLQPDIYESNNTEVSAKLLTLNFSGANGGKTTDGSTIHIGNDVDYYKITVPSTGKYVVRARVHDTYSSGNGSAYTNDVMLAYKIAGQTWSEPYDDVMPTGLTVNAGTTVYFLVSPFFVGQTGTYLLDIKLSPTTATDEPEWANQVKVYPNPTSAAFTIEGFDNMPNVQSVRLVNALGQSVFEEKGAPQYNRHFWQIETANLPNGQYVVLLQTGDGVVRKKIIVAH